MVKSAEASTDGHLSSPSQGDSRTAGKDTRRSCCARVPSYKAICGAACAIIQFVVLLCVLLSTALDALCSSDVDYDGRRKCFNIWGSKPCGVRWIAESGRQPLSGLGCPKRRDIMAAVAAFTTISAALAAVGLALTVLSYLRVVRLVNIVAMLMCGAAFLTMTISWLCLLWVRRQRCPPAPTMTTYRMCGGFGFLVTAWILELSVCVLIFFA